MTALDERIHGKDFKLNGSNAPLHDAGGTDIGMYDPGGQLYTWGYVKWSDDDGQTQCYKSHTLNLNTAELIPQVRR